MRGNPEQADRNDHGEALGGNAIYYKPSVRYKKEGFHNKAMRDIWPENNRVPHLTVQMLANDLVKAETILQLFIERGYKQVDINMGCPFPMLAKRHNGSGILPYPDEVKQVLQVVSQHPEIDFSVKMRLGWDQPEECLALAPILNDTPLKQITLHPRLGRQQYRGDVDLDGFAAFAQVCQHPLIYNGDILQIEDIERIHRNFSTIKGVMIRRGLLDNPALALD